MIRQMLHTLRGTFILTMSVGAIATASEQQSAASDEIGRSVEQVATISAETAQTMENAAHAVDGLAPQAQVLQRLINDMKTPGQPRDIHHFFAGELFFG